jgi:hypothetical protein
MIQHNTRESAIRREEFHAELRAWLDDSLEGTVGDPTAYGGPAWLWVRHGGSTFYLDAESGRDGVRSYLRMVEAEGGDPDWTVVEDADSGVERVGFGPRCEQIPGFLFYRDTRGR